MQDTLENITSEEFDKVIQHYISWASTWDGALPADVFFGLWADFTSQTTPSTAAQTPPAHPRRAAYPLPSIEPDHRSP